MVIRFSDEAKFGTDPLRETRRSCSGDVAAVVEVFEVLKALPGELESPV